MRTRTKMGLLAFEPFTGKGEDEPYFLPIIHSQRLLERKSNDPTSVTGRGSAHSAGGGYSRVCQSPYPRGYGVGAAPPVMLNPWSLGICREYRVLRGTRELWPGFLIADWGCVGTEVP